MLRHLLQPQAMTYISSHPEGFYKKVFLKVSQNSQEKKLCRTLFHATLIKTRLWHKWFSVNFAKLV